MTTTICLLSTQWLLPGSIFFTYFTLLMLGFSWLDYLQPKWYRDRAVDRCDEDKQTIAYAEIVPTVLKNMLLSFLIGTFLWSLRIHVFPDCSFNWNALDITYFHILFFALMIIYALTGASEVQVAGMLQFVFLILGFPNRFLQLFLSYVVSQIAFSINHHMAHRFNFHWHHQHHRYHSPKAICAFYCGWQEMLLLNLPVAELGPLLFNLDPVAHTLWLLMAGTYVTLDHCGHQLGPTWLFNTHYHHRHHKNGNMNHGSFILDQLSGL